MSGAILIQSLKQLWGMIVLEYKYHGNLPNIENYHTQVNTLFHLMVNGWLQMGE